MMLEPYPNQPIPEFFHDWKRMWRELEIEQEQLNEPRIDHFLQTVRNVYRNGGAEFASFRLSEHPTLIWYGSRRKLSAIKPRGTGLSSTNY
jgi:hypothetical protein